ncbi:hypothetical protein DEJ34_14945 [Curtobacterium sp. MCPF17_050]|uniref:hypothetical protein n=1 Tax=Curtobacterium sp. MCPF17_050 TaxID=2175664 RepID=UPI0011B3D52A|nr:hypothetical protein [Curtobacterium sp. MCPF17_050]WIB15412.1 hypothetical protein DEJ34_14945 [Curtobacterium sp. MCPF17_050]
MRRTRIRQGTVRTGREAQHRAQHRYRTTTGAVHGTCRGHLDLQESHVFDVFVVAGVLAVFGVVTLIAKGVERL